MFNLVKYLIIFVLLMKVNLAYQSIHNAIISKMDKCQVLGDYGKEWNLKEKNYNAPQY